jgi:uncharacterized membrane protein YphA (DoxX/SURF4 family)
MNEDSLLPKLTKSAAPRSTILIRMMVGAVFLSEGIQKFLYADSLGVGRFEKMGFENAAFIAPTVGGFEILCGFLVLIGLYTRLAAIPLITIMLVAIVTTKIPILLGHDLWGFHVRSMSEYGFWSMAHEMRTDYAMLLGALFLLIVGAGKWSVDGVSHNKEGTR